MKAVGSRDTRILEQVFRLQNAVQAAPDADRLREVLLHGLAGLPGVRGCEVALEGRVVQHGTLARDRVMPARRRTFPLASITAEHGVVVIDRASDERGAGNDALIANVVGLAALRLDSLHHARELSATDRALSATNRALARDLAEHEDAAARALARERLAQRLAHIGLWEVDLRTGRMSWSEETASLWGFPRDRLRGAMTEVLDRIHPDDRTAWRESIRTCTEDGHAQGLEFRLRLPDGTARWVATSGDARRDPAGRPVSVLGVVMDITARKDAEQDREYLQAQLNQAQKVEAIGQLAGGVAHDLNNLLAPILGYSEMLLDDLGPRDVRRHSVEAIHRSGERARDLVKQLLAFSRKQTLAVQPVDLGGVVREFESLLRRTIPEDIAVRVITPPDLPLVAADVGQIEQVIMNLTVNAADAMPGGGELTLETSVAELDRTYARHHPGVRAGRYVQLAVSDTGAGMPPAVRDRVFEPFYSTKGEQGTGLGLSVAYGIVKQHGGNIWVYSEEGRGTTFKVYLPVAAPDAGPDVASAAAAASAVKQPAPRGREIILLAEDDHQVRSLARAILERQGYAVVEAAGPQQALDYLDRPGATADLLLTDVVMPGMNGRELHHRCAERAPGLKVLFMSGYTDDVIGRRGMLDNGVHFLQKPFSVQTLASSVREALDEG